MYFWGTLFSEKAFNISVSNKQKYLYRSCDMCAVVSGNTGADCEPDADTHCLHHCDIYIYTCYSTAVQTTDLHILHATHIYVVYIFVCLYTCIY